MNLLKNVWHEVDKGAFWISLVLSIVFATVAFFTPPQAVIDSSILACIAEFWSFAALATVITAVSKGKNVTVSKGDTSLTVHDDDEVQDSGEYDQMKP